MRRHPRGNSPTPRRKLSSSPFRRGGCRRSRPCVTRGQHTRRCVAPHPAGVAKIAAGTTGGSDEYRRGQKGYRRSDRKTQELGSLGQGRSDRHAQPCHTVGHRQSGGIDPHRQGLRARHSARPWRAADRPVRRPLESDPHHAGDRHRCGRRGATTRCRSCATPTTPSTCRCRARPTGTRLATSSTKTRCTTASTRARSIATASASSASSIPRARWSVAACCSTWRGFAASIG